MSLKSPLVSFVGIALVSPCAMSQSTLRKVEVQCEELDDEARASVEARLLGGMLIDNLGGRLVISCDSESLSATFAGAQSDQARSRQVQARREREVLSEDLVQVGLTALDGWRERKRAEESVRRQESSPSSSGNARGDGPELAAGLPKEGLASSPDAQELPSARNSQERAGVRQVPRLPKRKQSTEPLSAPKKPARLSSKSEEEISPAVGKDSERASIWLFGGGARLSYFGTQVAGAAGPETLLGMQYENGWGGEARLSYLLSPISSDGFGVSSLGSAFLARAPLGGNFAVLAGPTLEAVFGRSSFSLPSSQSTSALFGGALSIQMNADFGRWRVYTDVGIRGNFRSVEYEFEEDLVFEVPLFQPTVTLGVFWEK